jgi:hypothetical protein
MKDLKISNIHVFVYAFVELNGKHPLIFSNIITLEYFIAIANQKIKLQEK